ncbi:hypothetical protein F0562_025368 [Nyssa sinensis]|uniref:Uncharacterized protein n=1 Tax=Nyssa sinensis TaxID=561372 RepID=A0A5J5BE05_9ASTE|nr:hypothetical protein F0562_025368 [Nyssa sinensis]
MVQVSGEGERQNRGGGKGEEKSEKGRKERRREKGRLKAVGGGRSSDREPSEEIEGSGEESVRREPRGFVGKIRQVGGRAANRRAEGKTEKGREPRIFRVEIWLLFKEAVSVQGAVLGHRVDRVCGSIWCMVATAVGIRHGDDVLFGVVAILVDGC